MAKKEKDFQVEINKLNNKIKCLVTYKTDFLNLEETISLEKV